ncbi:hypothetical protein LXL04_034284 [Taraxacum kok-saghyz]
MRFGRLQTIDIFEYGFEPCPGWSSSRRPAASFDHRVYGFGKRPYDLEPVSIKTLPSKAESSYCSSWLDGNGTESNDLSRSIFIIKENLIQEVMSQASSSNKYICECDLPSRVYTSRTKENSCRKYCVCRNSFVKWVDDESADSKPNLEEQFAKLKDEVSVLKKEVGELKKKCS